MRDGKNRGEGRDPVTSFRLPGPTLSQVKVTADAFGVKPSDLYRWAIEGALASFSLTGSEKGALENAK